MSDCNCDTNGENTPLPTLADVPSQGDAAFCAPQATPVVPPCPEDDNTSESAGSSASAFLDAAPTESMTIIGRTGKILSKFTGNGFIRIDKGLAYLVASLPMKVNTLYHYMTKMVNSTRAVVGDPRPYPFKVITDSAGNTHLVSGLVDNNSVEVWDKETKTFSQVPVGSFPVEVVGCLPKLASVELVGFGDATAEENCSGTGRAMHALTGNGIMSIIAEAQDEEGSCGGVRSKVSITTFPDDDQEYYIRWNKLGGVYYEPKNEVQDGVDGTNGTNGTNGAAGADGLSNYAIWLAEGNIGSEQDFLDSQKGQDGNDGLDGNDGNDGANLAGTLDTTALLVDQTNLLSAKIAVGANLNATGQVALNAADRSDAGWLLVGGTGVFTFTTVDVAVNSTVIIAGCQVAIGAVGDLATVDADITMELFKGGTLVASDSVFFEKATTKTQDSFNLSYVDHSPAVASYSLVIRKVGASTATILVQSGSISANAVKKRSMIETAEFTVT